MQQNIRKQGISQKAYCNKIHTIDGHIIDQITMIGRTLGSTDDQVIEACHQDLNKGQDKKNIFKFMAIS